MHCVDFSELTPEWHENWWDGPLSGVATWNGRRVYFRCLSEDDDGDRRYAIYEPPAEWWKLKDADHALFQQHVGTHWDGDRTGAVRPESEWRKYYDHQQKLEVDEAWRI